MSARAVMACSVEGCGAEWWQIGSARHNEAVRRAIRRGWTVGERGTGCPCGRDVQCCPDHADHLSGLVEKVAG